MNLAVQIKNLEKSFNTEGSITRALCGIDLDIPQGKLMMLVGPSGCGKTTLISVIAGILKQDKGSCEIFGKEINFLKENEKVSFRGRNIGFVFQSFNLIPALNVLENVSVPLIIQNTPQEIAYERASKIIERVGLKDKILSYPNQLSGGQQQRVAIARSLVHSPKLIVCDEPTSALDHENGARVMELFKEVALEHDRTLIVVTHDNRIFEFADLIAQMDDGRIVNIK